MQQGQTSQAPRVLVIDPREDSRTRAITHSDSQLVDLASARTVEEAVRGRAPADAFLLDVMAASPGELREAVSQLRATKPDLPTPVAVTSSLDAIESRLAAARAGADMFLVKPIGRQALRDAIFRLLEQASAPQRRVLVIDDDEDFVALMEAVLGAHGYRVVGSTDSQTILEGMRRVRPDAVLMDFSMPRYHGAELTRMLRNSREFANTPIIFVSARKDTEAMRRAFEAGADDFLLKPLNIEDLRLRLEARIARSKGQQRAERDQLTGTLTRSPFIAALENRLASSKRNCTRLSLCLLDLDHFKRINDTYGHPVGDRVLTTLGDLLESAFRAEDLKCRWGGEEFALAFPDDHEPEVVHVLIEKLLDELKTTEFRNDDGETFHVTFSAGIAHYVPSKAGDGDLDALIDRADRRLYLAKASGRATVVSSDPAGRTSH